MGIRPGAEVIGIGCGLPGSQFKGYRFSAFWLRSSQGCETVQGTKTFGIFDVGAGAAFSWEDRPEWLPRPVRRCRVLV